VAQNEQLCYTKSYILHKSDKLCSIKMIVKEKNSQTRIAAVRHRTARRLNKDTEYSLTCGHTPLWSTLRFNNYAENCQLPWWQM